MPAFVNITNQRFGRLLVLKVAQQGPPHVKWLCLCDCGNRTIVRSQHLREEKVRSCGCRQGMYRHGFARDGKRHPLHKIWSSMRHRCNNPNDKAYKWYGGRGIKVCKRWNDFSAFLSDMGPRPHGKVLDRINNDGNYTPSNVRWATWKQSANNKRQRGQAAC